MAFGNHRFHAILQDGEGHVGFGDVGAGVGFAASTLAEEGQAVFVRAAEGEIDIGAHAGAQILHGGAAGQDGGFQHDEEGGEMLLGNGLEDGVLVGEIDVEGGCRDTNLGRDTAHGDHGHAVLDEEALGGGKDLGLARSALAARFAGSRRCVGEMAHD